MKSKFNLILVGIITLLLYSCSNDEPLYSCDETIDTWVKDNITSIKLMDTSEFLNIDVERQRAAYRAFSSEQRQSIWMFKVNQVLELDWSDKEREHIINFQSILEKYPTIFTGQYSDEEKDEIDIACYKWMEYAKEILNWNNEQIRGIAFTPNKLIDKKGKVKYVAINTVKTGSENCNCNSDYIFVPDCDVACAPGGCNPIPFSCGMVFIDPCIGLCW